MGRWVAILFFYFSPSCAFFVGPTPTIQLSRRTHTHSHTHTHRQTLLLLPCDVVRARETSWLAARPVVATTPRRTHIFPDSSGPHIQLHTHTHTRTLYFSLLSIYSSRRCICSTSRPILFIYFGKNLFPILKNSERSFHPPLMFHSADRKFSLASVV